MTKSFISCILAIVFSLSSGITGEPADTSGNSHVATAPATWTEAEEMGLEDAIASSNCVVRSKYISREETDEYVDYCFEPVEVFKGAVDGLTDGRFFVRSDKGSDGAELKFSDGEYILPLKYVNSVYLDNPVYNVMGHYIIPCSADGSIASISVWGETYSVSGKLASVKELAELIKSIKDTSEQLFEDYIHSTALGDIISGSDFIVKAKITEEPLRSGSDRGIYHCELVKAYKGEVARSFDCIFKYDSVKAGEEYYLFLTKNSPTSRVYMISSQNSVYSSADKDVAAALKDKGLM